MLHDGLEPKLVDFFVHFSSWIFSWKVKMNDELVPPYDDYFLLDTSCALRIPAKGNVLKYASSEALLHTYRIFLLNRKNTGPVICFI